MAASIAWRKFYSIQMVLVDRNFNGANFHVVGAKHFAFSLWSQLASAEKQ
jgi:hypothetical protein